MMAIDLRNYLELRPVSARPVVKVRRIGRMVRRRPWVVALLLLVVTTCVLGIFLAKEGRDHERSRRENERVKKEAEDRKAFAKRVDEGDVALFRCLTGQRPTWLPEIIEQHRQ